MTASIAPQQTWKQLSAGTSLSGAGVFGFTGAHKNKAGATRPAASATGTIADPSLSFNKLFANDLSKNALSQTDPAAKGAAPDASDGRAAKPGEPVAEAATSGSDDDPALSGPLSSGLMAFLLGLAAAPAQGTADAPTDGSAEGDATVQAASAGPEDAGSDAAPESLQDLLDELDQVAGLSDGEDLTAYDDLPSGENDVAAADRSASPASIQATALLEMQKALTAYVSGNLTNGPALAAATSLAV